MSPLEAVALGVGTGLAMTGARVAWVLWTTRLNTIGDYTVAAIMWWRRKR